MEESILSIKLKEYRLTNSLTQQELAEKLDVSDKSISQWELGNTYPSKKNIIKISELLGISMELLLLEEVVEEKQHKNLVTKYLIPLLLVSVLFMTIFSYIKLETIKRQDNEIAVKNKILQQQKIDLETTYDYHVVFVLIPGTPYSDFKEYIEKNYKLNDGINVNVLNEENYIVMSFIVKAHNNNEMELFFQEMKENAPGLSNAQYNIF